MPDANILGEVNKGFAIANDRLTRQRIPCAPLLSRQAIQWMLVDNELDIKQSRWVTLEAADRAERGESFRKEVAMAKLVATEAGSRVVDRCMQIHGGYGVTKDFPF